jgi:hypothetical protein
MVDYFVGSQQTAKMLLHDVPVFKNVPAFDVGSAQITWGLLQHPAAVAADEPFFLSPDAKTFLFFGDSGNALLFYLDLDFFGHPGGFSDVTDPGAHRRLGHLKVLGYRQQSPAKSAQLSRLTHFFGFAYHVNLLVKINVEVHVH